MPESPTQMLPGFDYASLDTETRIVVQQKTGEIRERVKRTQQDIIEVGERLIDVKSRLGHGRFLEWLRLEFDWTDQTARNLMNVAEAFKSKTVLDLPVSQKALYVLAAPSVPPAAREEAVQKAANGQHVTYSEAKAIIATHKPASPRPTPDPPRMAPLIPEVLPMTPAPPSAPRPEFEPPPATNGHAPLAGQASFLERDPDDPVAECRRWQAWVRRTASDLMPTIATIRDDTSPGLLMSAPKWLADDLEVLASRLDELRAAAGECAASIRSLCR
jgi:hypothetical protein